MSIQTEFQRNTTYGFRYTAQYSYTDHFTFAAKKWNLIINRRYLLNRLSDFAEILYSCPCDICLRFYKSSLRYDFPTLRYRILFEFILRFCDKKRCLACHCWTVGLINLKLGMNEDTLTILPRKNFQPSRPTRFENMRHLSCVFNNFYANFNKTFLTSHEAPPGLRGGHSCFF